jgi:hypothetical protein
LSPLLFVALLCRPALAQIVDNPGFRALPRPINYATPLAPSSGAKAVIVYGTNAPWTRKAATALQQAVQAWSGVTLELADDRTVTSEETWLLADAYRKTPMVVLGSAQDNRVIHALGTRYLAQSNRTWPGGDRFVLRTVFEPFVADVNYIVLEASGEAGLDGAVAQFGELLKTFPGTPTATIPYTRVVAGVKDQWSTEGGWWKPPQEWSSLLDRSASQLALAFRGEPVLAGDDFAKAGLGGEIYYYTLGGIAERPPEVRPTVNLTPGMLRAMAAMYLLGYRAVGGRTHRPFDHYGAMNSILGARCFLQAGFLTEQEVNEFENAFTLSAADPNEYIYNHIGAGNGVVGGAWGGRHCLSCLLITVYTLDYVLGHCRMDDRTRKEVERRYEGARKTTERYVRSYRDNGDDSCLGEDTLLQVYCLLHQGLMENVRNGNLRRSADLYVLTTDNLHVPGQWPYYGCYAGLSGFSSGPGGMTSTMVGRGLLDAAAFYTDDPQYRWLARNWLGPKWTVPATVMNIHLAPAGEAVKPTMYDGVRALPYDERLYGVLEDRESHGRAQVNCRLPAEPFERAVDRVAFRDGMDPQDAYLFLAASQDINRDYPAQNNSIARYTDLGELWLFHNTTSNTTWARNVVSLSNGGSYLPRASCLLEALANLGEVSLVASREPSVAGADWTRTIVHWRGHYFAVLDRMEAQAEDQFAFVCRWRSPQSAALAEGIWTATAPNGSALRIQNPEPVFQTAECWENDGAARPYVLQQYKRARLRKGQAETFQNLLWVSGANRPDAFEARRLNATSLLVKGTTAAGGHLALIAAGGPVPLPGFETDAKVTVVMGNRLHLAEVTTLRVRVGGGMRDVVRTDRAVNLLLDCDTALQMVEKGGARASFGAPESVERVTSQADIPPSDLPKPAAALQALWARASAPTTKVAGERASGKPAFSVKTAPVALQRPWRRVARVNVSSTPQPALGLRVQSWPDTSQLEITLALPQPTVVECLRLVTVTKMVPMYGLGSQGYGQPHYEAGDFRFSLVLSQDGFQKDVRKIESPPVVFEETPSISVGHSSLMRLPTWRIAVNGKAQRIKLLPRATTRERAALYMTDLEVYAADRVDELAAQAFAADINGDGANELVVGTSQNELAAYDSDGALLWRKTYWPGDLHTMGTADLEADGRAEVLVYLTSGKLHRVNGDGSERPVADVYQASLDAFDQKAGSLNVTTLGVWKPGGGEQKEVVMWAEPMFRVLPDGTVKVESGKIGHPQGVGRVANLVPGEPEVLATVSRYGVVLWSSRRDEKDAYVQVGAKPAAGPDSGESRGLGWVQPVDVPGFRGLLTGIEGGLNWYPITAFQPNSKEEGWSFATGGVPAVAALAEDLTGDGVPEVFLARRDGFVNVFALADGKPLALLNTGEPILGMALLNNGRGQSCLAVGTKFGVHLFGPDFKLRGRHAMRAAAFAGPGGKNRDRVCVVDAAGRAHVVAMSEARRLPGRGGGR